MAEESTDESGPVDHLVVEFPSSTANFSGEMAKITALHGFGKLTDEDFVKARVRVAH